MYIPTKQNPADHLMQGTTLTELSQLKVWWEGPIFLSEDKSNWPQLETVAKPSNYARKLNSNIQLSSVATLVNMEELFEESWRLHPSRFSSWRRLNRVLTWVLRFINICKQENKLNQVELSVEEISDAESYIIKVKNLKKSIHHLLKRKNYLHIVSYLAFVQDLTVREY